MNTCKCRKKKRNLHVHFNGLKLNQSLVYLRESMGKYNLTEVKDKDATYRTLIRPELMDELYDKILNLIVVQKKYKDPDYSAKKMAEDLGTNTRYISAVVSMRFGKNYSSLVNEHRIEEAKYLLVDKRYADANIEDIGVMVGFSNRQSFYAAFYKFTGQTPRGYRMKHKIKK